MLLELTCVRTYVLITYSPHIVQHAMADQKTVKKCKFSWDFPLIRIDWCSVACVVKRKSGSVWSFPPNSWATRVVHLRFSVSAWHAEQVPDCSIRRAFHIPDLPFPLCRFLVPCPAGISCRLTCWSLEGAWVLYDMTCPSDMVFTKQSQLIDISEWIQENIFTSACILLLIPPRINRWVFVSQIPALVSSVHVGCLGRS